MHTLEKCQEMWRKTKKNKKYFIILNVIERSENRNFVFIDFLSEIHGSNFKVYKKVTLI